MARAYPVTVMVVALLAACSEPGPSVPTDEWTAPAWFAQQAREIEERTAALQACMDKQK